MFSELRAMPGDVLLYRNPGDTAGNLISFFSNLGQLISQGGKYVHSAVYIGSGRVLHSHLRVDKDTYISGAKETGVHIARIPEKDHKQIDIYRLPYELTEQQQQRLIDWYRLQLGKKYDLAAFPSSFFRSVIARIFGWKNFSDARPLLNDPNRWFCSELVSSGFMEALDLDIVPGTHPMSQTPADLGSRGSILKRIF